MWKFISAAWSVWNFIAPIYKDVMNIIAEIKIKGLEGEEARKEVFQSITDFIQKNKVGTKIPDSIMNAGIELCYQVYLTRTKKS